MRNCCAKRFEQLKVGAYRAARGRIRQGDTGCETAAGGADVIGAVRRCGGSYDRVRGLRYDV